MSVLECNWSARENVEENVFFGKALHYACMAELKVSIENEEYIMITFGRYRGGTVIVHGSIFFCQVLRSEFCGDLYYCAFVVGV